MEKKIQNISAEAKKMERLNKQIENADILSIDGQQKEKMIARLDVMNERLSVLEESSGLSFEEIEGIYADMTLVQSQDIVARTLKNMSPESIKNTKNVDTLLTALQNHIKGPALAIVAVAFFVAGSHNGDVLASEIAKSDVEKTELIRLDTVDIDAFLKEQMKAESSSSDQIYISEEERGHIEKSVVPHIEEIFTGGFAQKIAHVAIDQQKRYEVEHDAEVIMLFFSKPQENEKLTEYLIRQAIDGKITNDDVTVLKDYFSRAFHYGY